MKQADGSQKYFPGSLSNKLYEVATGRKIKASADAPDRRSRPRPSPAALVHSAPHSDGMATAI
jgi:hypothetical protein